jgi:hypothetical protein
MHTRSLLAVLAIALTPSFAAAQAFSVGDNVFAGSLGFGGHYRAFNSYSTSSPAIGLLYERGVTDLGPGVLGVGGYLGYKTMSYRSNIGLGWAPGYSYDYRWSYLIIGVRGAWHWNDWHAIDELDVYAGLMLSLNNQTFTDRSTYPDNFAGRYSAGGSYLGLTGFLGARYYFTPSIGAQLELGYGISAASLGVVVKF